MCSGMIAEGVATIGRPSYGIIDGVFREFESAFMFFFLVDWPFEVVGDSITFPYDFVVWIISDNEGGMQEEPSKRSD